ncbi:peptidoglycan-binding domain-containing protein [Streptomyces sp. SP17BM10]|uniref:peptidoglycan-binding domain-containing protein n=1 Tax=Streptomyces sp. SP17BM10 TaxID=3002530 RepID=UPI002E788676|nr:peptidoglycan-binding domain-containing protein [Streptomyces sp. SP17BM10]MEE1782256.1 peptidoglycan-binding domain-containing protein [Streptomyces sp. SP17BM10]
MNSTSMARRGAFLFATTALVTTGVLGGTAQAVPNSGSLWVGPGKSNAYASVRCVQLISNSLHYQTGYHVIDVDGSFGPDTSGAIQAIQKWASLDPDGIVGPRTGDVMITATKDSYGCYSSLPTLK